MIENISQHMLNVTLHVFVVSSKPNENDHINELSCFKDHQRALPTSMNDFYSRFLTASQPWPSIQLVMILCLASKHEHSGSYLPY